MSSASRPSEAAVKPTRSTNSTETRRRSATETAAGGGGAAVSFVTAAPHWSQKRAVGRDGVAVGARARQRRAAALAEPCLGAVLRAAARAGHADTRSAAPTWPARSSQGRAPSCSNVSSASSSSGCASSARPCDASHSACSSSVTARWNGSPSSRMCAAAAVKRGPASPPLATARRARSRLPWACNSGIRRAPSNASSSASRRSASATSPRSNASSIPATRPSLAYVHGAPSSLVAYAVSASRSAAVESPRARKTFRRATA